MSKRVLVVGSGCSGVTAMKAVVEEGMEPVCVERTDVIGGLWYFSEKGKVDGQSTVMRSTVINTSKEVMSFSDFPIPKEYPNYMHHTKVTQYFNEYVDHFDLRKYIQFNTEVIRISKANDFAATGQWDVTLSDRISGKEWKDVFDAVMLCTGHHATKKTPHFPGQEEFQGKILHSHDYKDQRGYELQRCLVVGVGNSGMDLAAELGRCAEVVYLSTRHGAWIITRKGGDGVPSDMQTLIRSTQWFTSLLPNNMQDTLLEKKMNSNFDHEKYGLKPEHRARAQHPSMNDDLPNRILCGQVIIKPNIKRFTKTGVEFDDGTSVDNIDAVFLATGYIIGFPFLDKDIIDIKDNVVDLYKFVYPPDLEKNTLAVIGCIQPVGAIMPIAELQCRWAARVFKGITDLPSKDVMWEDIHAKRLAMAKRYVTSTRHTIQVDWLPYMDELADQIGCKPNIGKLFWEDPRLAWRVMTDVASPCQYRLMGPHRWDGAREALLNVWDRVYYPLATRPTKTQDKSATIPYIWIVVVGILLALLYTLFV